MPWRIERSEGRYCVVKESDGSVEACHDTRAEANDHMAALYASESGKANEMNLADLCTEENGWRLFYELEEYATPPEWIPYLPKPGIFKHPRYGEINITPERNAGFVSNFKTGVYQNRLPLDVEHQTKLSGAAGWIVDMRTNEDGSADAQIEWTDRGRKLLEADRFRYISPEWYPTWTDPATEEEHKDVPVGGALTNRPFFKDKALRPLVANEKGVYAPEDEIAVEDITIVHFHQLLEGEAKVAKEQEETQATPVVSLEQYNELVDAHGALEAKFAETAQQAEQYRDLLDKQAERIAKMENDARRQKYAEMSADWSGDKEAHVLLLSRLTEAFGEESEEVAKYIELQSAHSAQTSESQLFEEIGTSAEPSGDTALERLESKARKLAEDSDMTMAQAWDKVLALNPELYNEYRQERRGR